jgi:multiple antibiotic resistance protein
LTSSATHEVRRLVAWRVARNAFFVLVSALLLGSLILSLYGISIPVLRVAGGFIVAVAGWKLLSEGSQKELEATADGHHHQDDPLDLAFYPLTLPLTTTGPGTIDRRGRVRDREPLRHIRDCSRHLSVFRLRRQLQRLLGPGGTDIAVRLSAFILFCLGIQILWSGGSELLHSVMHPPPAVPAPPRT